MKVGSEYYFYQNDHLGTPQKMAAVNGAVVWSAKYSSFGEATIDGSSTITSNLRFPGQYYDQETGLNYNWFRYYDPKIGRYLQADPIGLVGGINLFAYAWINPVNYIDFTGQKWCTPWIPTFETVWINTKKKSGTLERTLPSWKYISLFDPTYVTTYYELIEYFYLQETKKLRRYIRGCFADNICGSNIWDEDSWRDTGKREWKEVNLGFEWRRWDEPGPPPPLPES
jgi:RHS repeat-associated protein